FGEGSDLERYPRDERRDARLAAEAGSDLLFVPSVEGGYPPGFATAVEVRGLTDPLGGGGRGPEHFPGVATAVTKRLCMATPACPCFGRKDARRLAGIRRLVEALNLPVRIEGCPTVRAADGLAMSSRNALLSPRERARALALPAALNAACDLAAAGERSAGA